MVGAGFWARYQIAAWGEIPGVRLMSLCDRDEFKARELADEFGIPQVYASAEKMLDEQRIDFLDIATGPESHAALVAMAASRNIPVICQKPMALEYADCERMVQLCECAGVPLLIHENFRWQRPMRRIREILNQGTIGDPFRAHIQFSHGDLSFFDRQPYLYQQPHFAMFDMGPHILDLARFFLGEPHSVYAREMSVHPRFAGDDIVSILLNFPQAQCYCELSWRIFPYEVFLEGRLGTVTSYTDGRVVVETASGVITETFAPRQFAWSDAAYGFAHESIVDTNAHLAGALRNLHAAETNGIDNLRTMRLLSCTLESAANDSVIPV